MLVLEDAYTGSQLPFPYSLTRVSGVAATSVEVLSPFLPDEEGERSVGTIHQCLFPQ